MSTCISVPITNVNMTKSFSHSLTTAISCNTHANPLSVLFVLHRYEGTGPWTLEASNGHQ